MKALAMARCGAFAAALLLVAGGSAQAETVKLGGTLSPSSEVPPTDSHATGALKATLDTETHVLRWTVTYSGLTGPAKAAHFHGPATAGENAGIVVPLTGSLASPIKGEATITPDQADDLLAGKWYVNVHTAAHPPGEIRAQVEPVK